MSSDYLTSSKTLPFLNKCVLAKAVKLIYLANIFVAIFEELTSMLKLRINDMKIEPQVLSHLLLP